MSESTPRFTAVHEPTDAIYDSERDLYAPFDFGFAEALTGDDEDAVLVNVNSRADEYEITFEWLSRAEFEAEYA